MTLCSSRKNHSRTQIPSPPLHESEEATDPPLQLSCRRINKRILEKGYRGLNGLGTFHKRAKTFLSRISFRYFGVLFMLRSGYVYLPLIVQIEQSCVL